ncbi:MAG: hypothetical protein U0T83_02040 [Bacteriovoracaceae bacterium]
MNNLKIFGFSFIRNGIKYDYPYLTSLYSLKPITEKVYLAVGKSEDGTEATLNNLEFLKIFPTEWDETLREGGLILSQQTNYILDKLKADQKSGWGIYLQGDEVLNDEDYELIIRDLNFADTNGYDAVSFRFLHFWQNHHQIAINKKWYPYEIRAIKLNTEIESWGDAQSFRNYKKIFYSDATIYHYGHVRKKENYQNKKEDILKLYHSPNNLKKYQKREKKLDRLTKCIPFWGHHPLLMKERIESFSELFILPKIETLYIVGNENNYSNYIKNRINAKKIIWVNNLNLIPKNVSKNFICELNPSFLKKLLGKSTPRKMESKLSKDWTNDFYLTLCLSAKNISVI